VDPHLPFRDRFDAGQQLADRLTEYANRQDLVVLGLPRGGVPVAGQVAARLGAPLDVLLVRKLGVPGHEELAMGAVAELDVEVLNDDVIRELSIPPESVDRAAVRERTELVRRASIYRGDRPALDIRDRTALIVDDGLATGASMQAAVRAVRERRPARVIVAVPVGSREAFDDLGRLADAVVWVAVPEPFVAVGRWYDDFSQTTDYEVTRLLNVFATGGGSGRGNV
jgi:predicted phosphoribosyltransferase